MLYCLFFKQQIQFSSFGLWPDDKDIATICVSLKKINFPFKIDVANTNDVKTVEELEQACMELKVKLKEMLEQIKLEQINSDF